MSSRNNRKFNNDGDDYDSLNKKNWEAYSPYVRPIHYDNASQVIKNGGVKYTKTRSLFGPQKTTGQSRLDFNQKNRKKKPE